VSIFVLQMEAAKSSETLVSYSVTARHHNTGDFCLKNLHTDIMILLFTDLKAIEFTEHTL